MHDELLPRVFETMGPATLGWSRARSGLAEGFGATCFDLDRCTTFGIERASRADRVRLKRIVAVAICGERTFLRSWASLHDLHVLFVHAVRCTTNCTMTAPRKCSA